MPTATASSPEMGPALQSNPNKIKPSSETSSPHKEAHHRGLMERITNIINLRRNEPHGGMQALATVDTVVGQTAAQPQSINHEGMAAQQLAEMHQDATHADIDFLAKQSRTVTGEQSVTSPPAQETPSSPTISESHPVDWTNLSSDIRTQAEKAKKEGEALQDIDRAGNDRGDETNGGDQDGEDVGIRDYDTTTPPTTPSPTQPVDWTNLSPDIRVQAEAAHREQEQLSHIDRAGNDTGGELNTDAQDGEDVGIRDYDTSAATPSAPSHPVDWTNLSPDIRAQAEAAAREKQRQEILNRQQEDMLDHIDRAGDDSGEEVRENMGESEDVGIRDYDIVGRPQGDPGERPQADPGDKPEGDPGDKPEGDPGDKKEGEEQRIREQHLEGVRAYREITADGVEVSATSTVSDIINQLRAKGHMLEPDKLLTQRYVQAAIDRAAIPRDQWAYKELEALGINVDEDEPKKLLAKVQQKDPSWISSDPDETQRTLTYLEEAIETKRKLSENT